MRPSYHNLFLLTGFVAWLLLTVFRLTGADMGWAMRNLLIAVFFGGHWLYFGEKVGRSSSALDTEGLEKLLKSVFVAASVLALGLFALFVQNLLKSDPLGFGVKLTNMVTAYGIVLYFTYAMNAFKTAIFYRPGKTVYVHWRIFTGVLLLGAFFSQPTSFIYFEYVQYFLLTAGIILLLPVFVLRIKWISLPESGNKLITALYLSLIFFATIGLMTAASQIKMPGLLPVNQTHHVSLFLLSFGILGYTAFSILGIFFSLSLTSVMAEQKREIAGYRKASRVLNSEEKINEALVRLFDISLENTQSEAGWLTIYNNGNPQVQHTQNIDEKTISGMDDKLDFLQLNKKANEKGYHYFPDLAEHKVFNNEQLSAYRSLLALPVYDENQAPFCVLNLLRPYRNGFDAAAIDTAKNFAEQSKLAFRNTALVRQIITGERYREEMEIARKVQEALLPQTFPATEYCQIAALAKAAGQVGGDYYDYCKIDDKRLALIVGDVSGKGASAAFHMAQMKGIFQALMQLNLPADSFLVMANRAVSECMERNRFITALFILLDFEENTFTYSRAGHCPLLYYDKIRGRAAYFRGEGLGLGIIRTNAYIDHVYARELPLSEGDILLLYTDGIVEARKDADAEQYGYERLKVCLEKCASQNAEQIRDAIYADVLNFTQGGKYVDDSTLMVVKIMDLD